MASTLITLLTSGQPVNVDLLMSLPEQTDPSTWQKANWLEYRTSVVVPFIRQTQLPSGIIGSLVASYIAPREFTRPAAIGVSSGGMCVMTCRWPDLQLYGLIPFSVTLNFQIGAFVVGGGPPP